jgi:hypothetical protein
MSTLQQGQILQCTGHCLHGRSRDLFLDEEFLHLRKSRFQGKLVRTSNGCVVFLCLSVCLWFVHPLSAQRLTPAETAQLKFLLRIESRLSPMQRQLLSQPTRNSIALAHQLFDPPDQPGRDDDGGQLNFGLHSPRVSGADSLKSRSFTLSSKILPKPSSNDLLVQELQGGLTKISHPEIGLQLSRLGGFIDNESSSAQCGSNIVTAFQSETAGTFSSLIPTLNDPAVITDASDIGVSFSSDEGSSFTQLAFLHVGPSVDSNQPAGNTARLASALGNPVAACSGPKRFYIADSPFFVGNITFFGRSVFNEDLFSGVGVNTSNDGGKTWGNTAPTVLKDEDHLIDSGWLTIDPTDANRLYVSYIDFDSEADLPLLKHPSPRCAPVSFRIASELVTSSDGGRTWSSPRIIREDCLPIQNGLPQGFQVGSTRLTVGADGKLSAVFLLFHPVFAADGVTVVDYKLEIHARQSSDHGTLFGPEVKVSDLVQIGDGSHAFRPAVQGFFSVPTIPVIAADPASRPGQKQNLYIAWADGRDNQKPDGAAFFGTYNFGDIMLSRSSDGGKTWSPPRPISPTPRSFKGGGRDQFIPSIAVDRDGTIAVCYYDRRNDPQNNAFDRYCSISQNQGQTFRDVRQSSKSWTPGQDWDRLGFWLGDYDMVTAPYGTGRGFFGAFGISGDDVTGVFGRSVIHE